MRIDQFIETHRSELGKPEAKYERKFAEQVLAQVPGLDLRQVSTQTSFRDIEGKPRRIDFTITEGPHVRIAIEVDGWDKTGQNRGMNRQEFFDWSLREVSITADGWRVLRFANSLLNHEPGHCIRAIELTLESERRVAEQLTAVAEERSALAERVAALESQLREARSDLDQAQARNDSARVAEVAEQIERLEGDRQTAVSETLTAAERGEASDLEHEREQAMQQLRDELQATIRDREELGRENRHMKTVAVAFAAALAAVAVIVIATTGGDDGGSGATPAASSSSPNSSSNANSPGNSGGGATSPDPAEPNRCLEAISWKEARNQIGTDATVRGPVVGAVFAETTKASPTYLNVGKDFPDEGRFTVVIFGDDRKNFRGAPEDAYEGKEIAVEGEISEFRGVAQIIANHRNDIAVC